MVLSKKEFQVLTPTINSIKSRLANTRDRLIISNNDEITDVEDKYIPNEDGLDLRQQLENFRSQNSFTKPIKTVQYSDNHGKLNHVLLSYKAPSNKKRREQLLNSYSTLITESEPDTKFTIIGDSSTRGKSFEKKLMENLEENNVETAGKVTIHKPSRSPSIWARDSMIPVFSPDNSSEIFTLNPRGIHNKDEHLPALLKEKSKNINILNNTGLVTDGGDVVSNRRESFVGYDSIAQTAKNLRKMTKRNSDFNKWAEDFYVNQMDGSPEDVKRKVMYEDFAERLFEEYMGKPVTVVGRDDPDTPVKEKPAAFHTDMVMNPIDDETFFLGDPEMFDNMVAEMTPEERKKADEQFAKIAGKNMDFDKYTKTIKKEKRQYLYDRFWLSKVLYSYFSGKALPRCSHNKPEDFDAYEKTLEDQGYNVIRLPFQHCWDQEMPTFTYNNCLTENFEKDGEQVKRAFLPVSGVDYFDDYAVKEYEKQGFDVHAIPMGHVSKLQGTLRCTTNLLERSEKI
jgi:hypothetical protein